MPYVVLEPESSRRIYASWDACKAAIADMSGVQQMFVETVEEGEQMLAGGIRLDPRLYAFTDGNARGGVGVVLVRGREDPRYRPFIPSIRAISAVSSSNPSMSPLVSRRSSCAVFGITTTPCWMCHRTTTCAGVTP